ncbi:hypothetical protein TCAL_03358 [Tigriopus californicus]|uniref:Nitroreductase domain-containing protein n=1 Tax=Tigriopus californicus TaxID=6832 RepID=A0A553P6L2_TIGCA|nr:hypothetical protein TCAL_03358 [Tigriopus californicus]
MAGIVVSALVLYWPYLVILALTFELLRPHFQKKKTRAFPDLKAKKVTDVYEKRKEAADDSDNEGDDGDDDEYKPPIAPDVPFVPYTAPRYSEKEMLERSQAFFEEMNQRRTIRFYSDRPVPMEVMESIIRTAGTSPSGAHTEPWTYVVLKEDIRAIVEAEEEINYTKRMAGQWTADLKFVRTEWTKPYLTEAPYIVLLFKQVYGLMPRGRKKNHYYNEISCSISCGLFLAAVHHAGLATLTSTPMNCGPALRQLLNRPENEKLLLLLPVGYPSDDAMVPGIGRKPLDEIMVSY